MTFPSVWEMLHVRPLVQADEALVFSPSSDLRPPARKKAEPQNHRFPSQGTESITWSARRLVNAQPILW
jgi:hypothetical protein